MEFYHEYTIHDQCSIKEFSLKVWEDLISIFYAKYFYFFKVCILNHFSWNTILLFLLKGNKFFVSSGKINGLTKTDYIFVKITKDCLTSNIQKINK